MSDETLRPVVVKRIRKAEHGHHGGAWKIAYADFVTAMMAFFLLMWLLGSTTDAQRKGISEYFQTPLKVALSGGATSGDTTSIVKGGGDDVTKAVGQDDRADNLEANPKPAEATPPPVAVPAPVDLKTAEAEIEKRERSLLEDLKVKLEESVESNPLLKQYKNQILLDITSEGLRVQIVDEQNRPMFTSGSARLQPYTGVILREIGKVLNEVPNKVSLSGHTDAKPYAGGERGYSNWELSADRANASRRELIAGGMGEAKMLRVVGLGSSAPFDKENPFNPVNRRISIIVLNRKAEEALQKGDPALDTNRPGDVTPQSLSNPPADDKAAGAVKPMDGRAQPAAMAPGPVALPGINPIPGR
jgi:chemotaxis protein MotB